MIATPATTVRDFYTHSYQPLRLRSASQRTRSLYINTLNNFDRFLERTALLSDLTDESLSRFIGWHLTKGNSPATANKDAGQLLALWRFAARKRLVEIFPDVQLEREPQRVPVAWIEDELPRLLWSCDQEQGSLGGVPAKLWWHTLHLVQWDTAERIGAVRALTWDHIDIDRGWIIFEAESRKGRTRDRAFSCSPDTLDYLKMIRFPIRKDVFPWPFTSNHIYNHYRRILRRAGLPTDRKSKFHRMRKTAASFFAAAGGDPQDLLDHTSRKTTRKYLDPRIVKPVNPKDLLFSLSSLPKPEIGPLPPPVDFR